MDRKYIYSNISKVLKKRISNAFVSMTLVEFGAIECLNS